MKKINLKNSIILSICFCIFGVNVYASDNEWEFTNPEQEGVNSSILKKLSGEFKSGKHGYVDAFLLIRITETHQIKETCWSKVENLTLWRG